MKAPSPRFKKYNYLFITFLYFFLIFQLSIKNRYIEILKPPLFGHII
jgi:hypothetical protein